MLLKKGTQRVYFLKRLKSFRVKPDLLENFYQATIESIIWYNSLCFFNSLRIVDAAPLHRLAQTASMLIGSEVTDATVTHTMCGRSSGGYGPFWLMKIIL